MPRERSESRPTNGPGPEHYLEGLVHSVNDLGTIVSQLRGEISTLNGVRQLGINPRPFVAGQTGRLSTSSGRLAGFSIRETTGAAAAVVRLRDGSDATGDLLATIALLGGASVQAWFMPSGVSFGYGLFLEVTSGAVEAVVYLNGQP